MDLSTSEVSKTRSSAVGAGDAAWPAADWARKSGKARKADKAMEWRSGAEAMKNMTQLYQMAIGPEVEGRGANRQLQWAGRKICDEGAYRVAQRTFSII